MNLMIFIITLIVSVIVVRLGAVAFNLTGLEWSMAKFQALSCFTSTGFTTREAELITGSPLRRRIASYLIVLGHAGLVAMVATFANSLRPSTFMAKFSLPFVRSVIPSRFLPWINLLAIVIAVYAVFKVFTNTRLARSLTNILRNHLINREIIAPVSFEELMLAPGGYGISHIGVDKDNPVLNKTLVEASLRKHDISVLVIERKDGIIPNPPADTRILLGDRLLCFGKLENMRKRIYTLTE